jgi:hypothetical protein
MSFEFYATPDEQKQWLVNQIRDETIWMLGWSFTRKYFQVQSANDIKDLSFEAKNPDDLIIYIGRSDLAHVLWSSAPSVDKIDFISSQAIQFVASITVEGRILLEGRIAIMRPSDYKLCNIDPTNLSRSYRKIRKSLSSIMAPDFVVVQRTTSGVLKEWHGVGVTPGAVSWCRKGILLKQFPEGAVEFDIKQTLQHPRRSAKERAKGRV